MACIIHIWGGTAVREPTGNEFETRCLSYFYIFFGKSLIHSFLIAKKFFRQKSGFYEKWALFSTKLFSIFQLRRTNRSLWIFFEKLGKIIQVPKRNRKQSKVFESVERVMYRCKYLNILLVFGYQFVFTIPVFPGVEKNRYFKKSSTGTYGSVIPSHGIPKSPVFIDFHWCCISLFPKNTGLNFFL